MKTMTSRIAALASAVTLGAIAAACSHFSGQDAAPASEPAAAAAPADAPAAPAPEAEKEKTDQPSATTTPQPQ